MLEAYYILENGEKNGPFTFNELIEKRVDVHTRILSPNDNSWEEACNLPELYGYFESQHIYFPTAANLATFGWRLLAYLIDCIILVLVMVITFNIFAANGTTFNKDNYNDLVKIQLVYFIILIIYNAVCESSNLMGSLGKKACKLVVVDVDGRKISFINALMRSVGKAISIFLLYTGFFSILFSEYKQALHDFLAKTYVIKQDL